MDSQFKLVFFFKRSVHFHNDQFLHSFIVAMEKREITCRLSGEGDDESQNVMILEPKQYDDGIRLPQRLECYNDAFKGVWRVGEWSGVKLSLIQTHNAKLSKNLINHRSHTTECLYVNFLHYCNIIHRLCDSYRLLIRNFFQILLITNRFYTIHYS